MNIDTEANEEFLVNLVESDDGHHKSASAASTDIIRKNIKEESILRRYHPLVMCDQSDLIPDLDSDEPLKREWMETDSLGAVSVPFGQNPEVEFFYQKKFDIKFNPLQSPQWEKNVFELMTCKGVDYSKLIIDNGLRYFHQLEDSIWLNTIYQIVGSVGGNGISGYPQHFAIPGGITRDSYKEVLNGLEDFSLNNGTVIMNRRTAKAFLGWGRDELGGDLSERLARKGLAGMEDNELFGVRHLFTIKRDLVPDGRVIVLADPNYFMRFYGLQDITMHVKKENYMVSSKAMEVIGMAFANVFGAVVYDFV